jgi:hypothetical protein
MTTQELAVHDALQLEQGAVAVAAQRLNRSVAAQVIHGFVGFAGASRGVCMVQQNSTFCQHSWYS